MSASEIIIYIMAAFMVLGALDRIFGSRFGLGKEFENGILAMGSLAMAMLGIISLAPVLAKVLKPVLVPVYSFLGADPAMFAGSILANDMGGATLAAELAGSEAAGLFGGTIVAAMLGVTIVFTIPVALGILTPEDRPYLARGVLAGVVTIPLGAFVGGICAGFPVVFVLKNLIPIALFALLIALGLWLKESAMIKGFTVFGKIVVGVITVGLAAAIIEALTGFAVIPGMAPITDGFQTVGQIAIVLAGALPLVYVITKVFRKPLMKLGSLLGMNDVAAAGMVASLANSIPMLHMIRDMDDRGKVLNIAFAVSASFVFGDHLGFTAGFAPQMLVPMIAGKLTGGVTAVLAALLMNRRKKPLPEAE